MFDLTHHGRVARLRLDRPAKRNAITTANWEKLAEQVDAVARSGARVLVIGSAVPGSFCAGADIAELATFSGDEAGRSRFRQAMRTGIEAVRACRLPTIAEIQGGCFGAGVALALACDIRVASPEASFAITPAKLVIAYPQEDVERLVRRTGRGQAARLLLSALTIDAEEAARIGLVEEVAADAEALAQTIAANALFSTAALKAALDGNFSGTDFDAAFGTPDFAEGVVAYHERRAPDFA